MRLPKKTSVVVGMLCSDAGPNFYFFNSWDSMKDYDFANGHLWKNSIKISSGPRIVETRSLMAETMLKSDHEWLLTIDADMEYPPDLIERMLTTAYEGDQGKRIDVLGALCFAGGHEFRKMYPTIYHPDPKHPDVFAPVPLCHIKTEDDPMLRGLLPKSFHGTPYPRDQLVKVYATGTGCLLVHRDVLVRMAAAHPYGFGTYMALHPDTNDRIEVDNPYPWFADTHQWGRTYGEDIVFCQRAQSVGYGIYCDTRIKIGHYKESAFLAEETWDYRLRAMFGESWRDYLDAKELALR